MRSTARVLPLSIALVLLLTAFAAAQDGGGFDFGFDLGIGVETFNEVTDTGESEQITWQTLSLNPDFAVGKFGIGLDITLHYRFTGGEGNEFEVRRKDWVPSEEFTFLELYLPMFRYVRWGMRGEPLYVKLGSIDDATLGNGFIMGNYANTLFLPEQRIFGLAFDLDGRLFNFPYVGFQSFFGNLAHIDVIAGRLFVRPLSWLSVPIIKNLELGGTFATDRDPYYHVQAEGPEDAAVSVFGADFRLPILTNAAVSLTTFGDIAFENENTGGMLGFGGRLFGFLPYVAQLRFLGDNFLPAYFGPTYDVYRVEQYEVATSEDVVMDGTVGWFASTGFSILEDRLALNIGMDGPFMAAEDREEDNWTHWPHLRGVLIVGEGLLPGFYLNASYDKKNIQSFADLVDPTDAVIGAAINYKTGPAVITLEYDVRYNPDYDAADPESERWQTTATLNSSISVF
jgi:hypothetical protein